MVEVSPEEAEVIRIFNHYVSRMALLLLLMELAVLLAAAALATLAGLHEVRLSGSTWLSATVFSLVMVFIMAALGMYRNEVHEDLPGIVARVLPAFALGFAMLSLVPHLVPSLSFLLGAGGVLMTRLLLRGSAQTSMLVQRLILVGDGVLARECLELARSRQGFHRFEVVGCVPVEGELRCVPSAVVLPVCGSLLALARKHGAHELVVSIGDRRNGTYPVKELLACALGGVRVIDAATFFEREASQLRIDSMQPSYLTFGGGFDQSLLRAAVKRGFDLAASAAICLITLPLMAGAVLAILLDDGGPVIYRQERVGRDGRLFFLLKFRSMRQDAEHDGQPRWAQQADMRITSTGRWLRKLRIDELPQLLNVFRGEMSFVGPRPERAFFVSQFQRQIAYYDVRHTIKPGITGLAQVRYQYGASIEDAVCKLQYDLYYVKNNSLFLDLLILVDTVQVVLFGKGSR